MQPLHKVMQLARSNGYEHRPGIGGGSIVFWPEIYENHRKVPYLTWNSCLSFFVGIKEGKLCGKIHYIIQVPFLAAYTSLTVRSSVAFSHFSLQAEEKFKTECEQYMNSDRFSTSCS